MSNSPDDSMDTHYSLPENTLQLTAYIAHLLIEVQNCTTGQNSELAPFHIFPGLALSIQLSTLVDFKLKTKCPFNAHRLRSVTSGVHTTVIKGGGQ